MKIIFDSEEQKNEFLNGGCGCPSSCGFNNVSDEDCWGRYHVSCVKCWEQSGIEIEVKEKTDENRI